MKKISTNILYSGYNTLVQTVFGSHKGEISREVIISADAVAAMVYNPEINRYGFVEQFRAGSESVTTECPAGIVDEGENIEVAIIREIREELGSIAIKLVPLGEVWQGPARVSANIYLFYCEVTGDLGQDLDEDEDVTIRWYTFEK